MSKVSIIVPNHNYGKYIHETVESIICQSYKDIELIIVDDASNDNSKDVILDYAECDSRIIPLILEKNIGVSAALNKGIKIASGDYVCFIASDDLMERCRIEKQIKFLKNNVDVDVLSGCYIEFFENQTVHSRLHGYKKNGSVVNNSERGCVFEACTAMFKLKTIRQIGMFYDGIKCEDWYMQLKLKEFNTTIHHINSLNTFKRTHDNNSHLQFSESIDDKLKISNMFPKWKKNLITSSIRQEQFKLIKSHQYIKTIKYFFYSFPYGIRAYMLPQLIKTLCATIFFDFIKK